jgi:putative ATP-binding cassette transporter
MQSWADCITGTLESSFWKRQEQFHSRKLVLERRRGGAKLVSDITLLRRPGKPRLIRRWLKRKLKTAA